MTGSERYRSGVSDRCIPNRDTVTRSWGPLLCHSSTTITSWCSMIMHGPMFQGSLHNSWKLKTSQFLHGQHTHWTCHPLSMFGMLWIGVYDSVFQFLPISSNFAQPLKRSGQPDQLYAKDMCCTAWGKWWSHQILTGFRTPPNTVKLHILEWPFIVAKKWYGTVHCFWYHSQLLTMETDIIAYRTGSKPYRSVETSQSVRNRLLASMRARQDSLFLQPIKWGSHWLLIYS